jgi:hypothetical protein
MGAFVLVALGACLAASGRAAGIGNPGLVVQGGYPCLGGNKLGHSQVGVVGRPGGDYRSSNFLGAFLGLRILEEARPCNSPEGQCWPCGILAYLADQVPLTEHGGFDGLAAGEVHGT